MKSNTKFLAGIFAALAFTVLGLCTALNKEAERNAARMAYANAYIAKYCQVVGFYGRAGEYRAINCEGKVMREHDIPTSVTELPAPRSK